jgi:hypothetical protein
MTIHVDGPFGGCDEQAETDKFEELCGSVGSAQQLFRLLKICRAESEFRLVAGRERFSGEQVSALLHLQGGKNVSGD